MLIPCYWAEARLQDRVRDHQVTLRRFGWSDISPQDAQANADTRVREAMRRVIAGETLPKRELKRPYAVGLPIREEIIDRRGEVIITRNVYGALCLNTPDVLFADIDFEDSVPGWWIIPIVLAGGYFGGGRLHVNFFASWLIGMFAGLFLSAFLQPYVKRLWMLIRGSSEKFARERIATFLRAHPDWHLRLYRTPAGLRLLALHRRFAPDEPAVVECFRTLGVDPTFARLCQSQQCFRARVSPKPWRIRYERPRKSFWPVDPARLRERTRWAENYENAARKYASCRFVEDLGSPEVDPAAQVVQILHDELSRANSKLPLA